MLFTSEAVENLQHFIDLIYFILNNSSFLLHPVCLWQNRDSAVRFFVWWYIGSRYWRLLWFLSIVEKFNEGWLFKQFVVCIFESISSCGYLSVMHSIALIMLVVTQLVIFQKVSLCWFKGLKSELIFNSYKVFIIFFIDIFRAVLFTKKHILIDS